MRVSYNQNYILFILLYFFYRFTGIRTLVEKKNCQVHVLYAVRFEHFHMMNNVCNSFAIYFLYKKKIRCEMGPWIATIFQWYQYFIWPKFLYPYSFALALSISIYLTFLLLHCRICPFYHFHSIRKYHAHQIYRIAKKKLFIFIVITVEPCLSGIRLTSVSIIRRYFAAVVADFCLLKYSCKRFLWPYSSTPVCTSDAFQIVFI